MTTTREASPQQRSYIKDLLEKKELTLGTGQTVEQLKEQADTLSMDQASKWLDRLIEMPDKQSQPAARSSNGPEPKAGMYRRNDGTIIRVYLGQQSGKMLAKKVVEGPPDHHGATHRFEYMGKATRFIDDKCRKLKLEEAQEFGRMTGTCCICAKRLDVPESVERGIGPVCYGRMTTKGF